MTNVKCHGILMSNVKCYAISMSNVKGISMSNIKCQGISISNIKCHGNGISMDMDEHHRTLCHRSSFNPSCDVHGILFLKTSYVSLMYKSRIVLKIFTSPFLSYTLPQRGKISNIKKSQTKPLYKI